jgi:putative redox protein
VTPKPPTVVDLTWIGDLKFAGISGAISITLDGDSAAGPSPVQALAFALASCMATDVIFILTKGRHPVSGLHAHLIAHRAQQDPHRFLKVDLQFDVDGAVPLDAVERAIALSREKYCSVWHSLNHDIDFQVTCNVHPQGSST